ncbi:GlxA family transcriptional regulator [Amycolatopsis magusensis]|uniref:GlxA family transcriptional regulator n=1 Tax=Amycolatopsis magusensis TaxID=882444 RepID=UPI001AE6D9C1|nr:DJ-1/PfpI family protein [Amycolatopsis magusensis]
MPGGRPPNPRTTVAFLLVPKLHLLDLAGPAQVFSSAGDLGLGYRLRYLAERPQVPTAQGIPVGAEVDWPELTRDDILLVPGWRAPELPGTGPIAAETLARIRAHHDAGGLVASVCAGADALGRAGLLDGRRCTTHHGLQEELARRYPLATVVRDVLYVTDGQVVTSAGIASGIDLSLHLIAVRHGPGVAARIAREMVVYARRNGEELQASAMLRHRDHLNDAVHRIQDLIDERFAERLRLADLARSAGCSERTITRLFGRVTGLTPLRYQQVLRVERAEHLIAQGVTVEHAARSVGFEDARMLRRLRSRG